ncbi:MAG TPA: hypothetical protein VGN16_25465 [Acidobacteriaceae bacterium]
MAARIIPFPQRLRRFSPAAVFASHAGQSAPHHAVVRGTSGLHVVPVAEALKGSQQQALRIVHEVEQCHAAAPSTAKGPQRTQDFWDTLPLPQSRRDTPLSVARRLMHILFEPAHSA